MVELGHQPPVGFPGGGEFFVAFVECLAQVEDLLAQAVGLFAEGGCVVGGAEPGALADLGAEQLGQALLEPAGVVFQAVVAFAQVGVVGQQRAAADGAGPAGPLAAGPLAAGSSAAAMTAARRSGWRWMKDRCTRARAATAEMVIWPGLAAHLGEDLADLLAAAGHVAAAGVG